MNFAYIDKKNKSKILFFRPENICFSNGHHLIILPAARHKTEKSLKKYNATLISSTASKSFTDKMNLKIIKQALKHKGVEKLVFAFENALHQKEFLQKAVSEKIDFYLLSGPGVSETNDYFLDKTGIPIKTATSAYESFTVYFGGEFPANSNCANILNLSQSKIPGCQEVLEYKLKNTSFPVKIDTISLLEKALFLTDREISDVFIKIGIFNENEE